MRKSRFTTEQIIGFIKQVETVKARKRLRGEHIFGVVSRVFRCTKVRYRGLKKNAAQITTLVLLAPSLDGAQAAHAALDGVSTPRRGPSAPRGAERGPGGGSNGPERGSSRCPNPSCETQAAPQRQQQGGVIRPSLEYTRGYQKARTVAG